MVENLNLNNVIELRKPHPCGNSIWSILRLGADIKIKCSHCNKTVFLTRSELEKRIKKIIT